MRFNIKDRYRRYRAWQESPFNYNMETKAHCCQNCGYEFVGNFCPRCGQKATVGKVTWSSVRENVMEIWGVGTRSMAYTIWQLLLRPGYFIRDYISGRRQVSFPPVKMLLILGLLCTLIDNLFFRGSLEEQSLDDVFGAMKVFVNWAENNQGWSTLLLFSMMILPTWVMFHHAPRCTAHSLPQGFFIQVFLSTLCMIFGTLAEVPHCGLVAVLIPLYTVIAYHQLFGYGLWGTLWRVVLCIVAAVCLVLSVFFLMMVCFKMLSMENLTVMKRVIVAFVVVMLPAACGAVTLAIGYAIGHWSWKRRVHTAR